MQTTTITTARNGNFSRCIASATYDHAAQTLDVVFGSALHTVYRYRGVTAAEWALLTGAQSLGKVWNRYFKGSAFTTHAAPVALAA